MTMSWSIFESPVGLLTIVASPRGELRNLYFPGRAPHLAAADRGGMEPAVTQLEEYFAGDREVFELSVELGGTPLQVAVWERLREIPYGETRSYGEVTEGLDESIFPAGLEPYERVRAVGTEIGRTPVPIVVPCHRVIGADGNLTGYGGGLHRKRALLELEQGVAQLLPLA
jgi:methylated-DNA-[protein]-cysteine S-methyltransferase